MTQEQYYWNIQRPQLLNRAYRLRAGGYSKTLDIQSLPNPYLFVYFSDGSYDEDTAHAAYEKYAISLPAGRCSSARRGKYHGRSYDWYFDRSPSFVVFTPKTEMHKHKTLGIATLMSFDVKDVSIFWRPEYDVLECATVDGINDAGIVCNVNVVPPGDNPRYPATEDELNALLTTSPYLVYNITSGTNPGKPRRFVGAMCRTILDNCATKEDIYQILNDYSWYAARRLSSKIVEEFHIMVSSKDWTLVIEFVENQAIVHEWDSAGTYLGCSNPEFAVKSQCLPIMTNFYLSNWDGNVENLGITPGQLPSDRNPTVTEFGMGYERYALLDKLCKENPEGWTDDVFMEKLIEKVSYRQIYHASSDDWASEFLLRTDDPETEYRYRQDFLAEERYLKYRARALARCQQEDADDAKGIRPNEGITWQTVHRTIYDIENLKMRVTSQETGSYQHTFDFSLEA